MKYENIAGTDLKVSKICLGSMTWGQQNSEQEAFDQLDYSVDQGVNFIDTAEIYPIPPDEKTYGDTERMLGNWLKKSGKRNDVIIATKIAGPGRYFEYIRNPTSLSAKNVQHAVDNSLERLGVDHIDLFQVHWPERKSNFFGQRGFKEDSEYDKFATPILETLDGLEAQVKSGKIRHIGVSNESCWGVLEYLRQHELKSKPKIRTIQNVYNLLNRSYEIGMAEISVREKVKLMAYSPLAFGVLTGKYLKGEKPANARLTLFNRFKRYLGEQAENVTELYVKLAEKHGLSPAQMSLAFVNQQPFVLSNIIGATTLDQLKENINSINIDLSQELLDELDKIHNLHPDPCP